MMNKQFIKLKKFTRILVGLLGFLTVDSLYSQGEQIPYGMPREEWKSRQQPANNQIIQHPQPLLQKNAIITNGGFETGDFTGWLTQDLTTPFIPLSVRPAGIDPDFGLFISEPTEGSFGAIHGFDGSGPGRIQIVQDISLPPSALSLEFDYRVGWDLITFCNGCNGLKLFLVSIRTGRTILKSDTILVAEPETRMLDSGNLHGSIDVSAFAGTAVRISFECVIQAAWAGPGFFQLDNVFVTETGPQISLSPDPVNFANVELGSTKSLTASLRNIGTQDVTVSSLSDPGGVFSVANTPSLPVVIQAGASETFEISFSPPDSGLFTANLTVESSDPNDPTLNVPVTGRGLLISHNVGLLANLNDYADTGYSDCWGYTAPNGDEYALLGVNDGVSIVAVTNPAAIAEVDFVPFVHTPLAGWYDIKTYQHYMYVSTEGSRSIQIVDLSELPDSVSIIGTFSGLSSEPHNLFIDADAALLYVVEDFQLNPSVRVFSLYEPTIPIQIATISQANDGADAHDVFAQDSVLYIAEGMNPSIGIYDMRDPARPALMARHFIPAAGYVHNVWVSEDNNSMITTEETVGRTVKIWDIQDLDNISLLSEYLGESQVAHNAYIKGHMIYISHYESGLKVLDFSDPRAVTESGFYDTYPQSDYADFNGAWGVYPFSQNEMIYVSDTQSGLYVLRLEDVVGVEDVNVRLPEQFSLAQNYPNPFNPSTTIQYELSKPAHVTLTIYNLLGARVRTLVERQVAVGRHQVVWNGRDELGKPVASGVYLYRLDAGTFSLTRRLVLMR